MSAELIGGLSFLFALVLLACGVHIGLVLALAGVLGSYFIVGNFSVIVGLLKSGSYHAVAIYDLSVVPMFILMGEVGFRGGISDAAFIALNHWVGRIRGGLGIATTWACAAFSATSGSSVATASVFTRIAYPEMKKVGYEKYFALGLIAAASTLDMLIPPSLYMVIYGFLAQQSIAKCLMAGFIPGILVAVALSLVIYIKAVRNPAMAPLSPITYTLKEKLIATTKSWPMLLLAAIILGGIYSGVFTPTEAASVGAFFAIVISMAQRKLSGGDIKTSLAETAFTSAMLTFVIIGATIFSRLMTMSGMPVWMGDAIESSGLSATWVIVIILVIYGILGCFIDALSIMFVTLPVFAPILEGMGVNMLWFAVLTTQILNLGTLTPPFGLCVYTVKAVAGPEATIEGVFKGTLFTYWAVIGTLIILVAFPVVSTIIPDIMMGVK